VDLNPEEMLTWVWAVDGSEVRRHITGSIGDDFLKITGSGLGAGLHTVNVTVRDASDPPGLSSHTWTIHVYERHPDLRPMVEFLVEEAGYRLMIGVVNEGTSPTVVRAGLHLMATGSNQSRTLVIRGMEGKRLDPGENWSASVLVTLPDWADSIMVVCDPYDLVLEGNETNNVAAVGLPPMASSGGGGGGRPIQWIAATSTAGLVLTVLVLAWLTEPGRVLLLSGLLPLYSRIRKDQMLNHSLRDRIFKEIKSHPGVHYRRLMTQLDLKNGTLVYHLKRLEDSGLIHSELDGMYRRYYPEGLSLPQSTVSDLYPVGTATYNYRQYQLSEVQMAIVKVLRNNPGLSQAELAKRLGLSRRVINYHARLLHANMVLRIEKDGRRTRCFVEDAS
jgi:predicted transcriptional regulator